MTSVTNAAMSQHPFLRDIKGDTYYPAGTWERGVDILVRLCAAFEAQQPRTPDAVCALTHAATEEFNAMIDDDIDLETVAREAIAGDIIAILKAYGHENIDIEEAIAPRDW